MTADLIVAAVAALACGAVGCDSTCVGEGSPPVVDTGSGMRAGAGQRRPARCQNGVGAGVSGSCDRVNGQRARIRSVRSGQPPA
jgi:hypothetical protein